MKRQKKTSMEIDNFKNLSSLLIPLLKLRAHSKLVAKNKPTAIELTQKSQTHCMTYLRAIVYINLFVCIDYRHLVLPCRHGVPQTCKMAAEAMYLRLAE